VRRRIGPCADFAFDGPALRQLGRLRRRGRRSEVDCLAAACVEIRDRGADAIEGHEPRLFDVYRCGYIIAVSVSDDGGSATVLDFYPAGSGELP
jgi:hypothetical protein